MSDPTTSLNAMAAVRQDGARFACVVRWMLGTKDDLPHADDVFDVTLKLTEQDGKPAGEVAHAAVSPRRFFMIDPPREPRPLDYPGGDTLKWLVAVRPTEGVDCAAADPGTLDGRAFGVCHLLSETDTSRVEWRAARVMFQAMRRRGVVASRFKLDAAAIQTSAITFAGALLRSRIRPIDLKPHLENSFRELLARAAGPGTERTSYDATGRTELLQMAGADVGHQFSHAALVVDALADTEVMDALDRAVAPPEQVRQHVRLRVLHGGELVDYWADPDGGGGPIADRDRGKRYPASELIGCGVRFDIAPADLAQWIKDKRTLVAEVAMRSRSSAGLREQPLDAIENGGSPGNAVGSDARLQFDQASWPIDYTLLKRAQLMGSSAPPEPPKVARVNYAMYQSDAARSPELEYETAKGPALGYSTGDGRVEIVIERSPSATVARSPRAIAPGSPLAPQTAVGGFNIYGMWEGLPETRPYFDDPSRNPTLDELKPWLITRRYSYLRDLKEAFPPIGGVAHAALEQALAAPPWQPVLIAPTKVLDLEKKEELPSFSPDGGTVFAFDLRKGMSSGIDNGLFIGWDGAAPASVLWSPERTRDGAAIPGAWNHPQRYRFWVTSVDAFDQESAPVPVRAEDADAGEMTAAFLFSPRRRAPLLGPPGSGEGFQLGLAFDMGASRLNVTFETPLENQVSGRTEATPVPPRVDKRALSAVVVIWRRRLTRRIDDSTSVSRRGLRTSTIPDLPQWADADASMRKDGWRFFTDLRVAAPASGDVWTASAVISDLMDSGWEYRAGVGFTVNNDRAPFFFPNVPHTGTAGRVAILANRTASGSYERVEALVSETPRASDVAMTNAQAVPNHAPARAIAASTSRVWPALPIPAPPGIRRDVVLLRLLTNDFAEDDVQLPRLPWRDTGVVVTIGQARMSDAALERTHVDGKPLPPGDPILHPTRAALAAAFTARETSGTPLRQHPTLGFRGLIDLRWHYVPLSARATSGASPEAEAVRFRVYATRAPQDNAEGFATVLGSGQLTGADTYAITVTKGDPEGWATIADQQVPTLVRILTADLSDMYGYVVDAGTNAGSQRFVRIERRAGETRPLPATAALLLFAAQPISEVDTADFEMESDYRHLLPIGGGDPDVFAWWVVSVSAQGKEASRRDSPAAIELFVGTLEPQTPAAFQVSPPTDFAAHRLPANSTWVPTDLTTEDDAKFSPRLVLTWAGAPRNSGLSIIVERDERAAASPARARARTHSVSAWQAIQTLEAIPEGADVDVALLKAIADNWLMGSIVDVEGSPVKVYEHVARDDRRGRIDATDGLKRVPSQEPSVAVAPRMRPGVIDYFGRNGNPAVVMDANWEFRYRLRFFTDLGPQLPIEWRFLVSRPTEWSPWLLPETPPLDVRAVKSVKNETDTLKAPQVRFKFVPRQTAVLRAMKAFDDLAPQQHWEFRVVVRRRVNVPLLNAGLTPDVWIDVGGPVHIQGSTAEELVDAEIERGWAGDRPQFSYRILVQQFLVVETPAGKVEKLVRGFDIRQPNVGNCEVPVDVEMPVAPTSEVEMIQTIEIR